MRSHYLPGGEPDLEDFFSQVVPTPPSTDRTGGMLFMAPFGAPVDGWFAYLRRGTEVNRFEGSLSSVRSWAQAQDVAERWIYVVDRAEYVPWPETAADGSDADHS